MGVTLGNPGLIVNLTHGDQCHNHGKPFRQTQIDMQCSDVGLGSPVTYGAEAEVGYCKYRFRWNSIAGCPVCTEDHYGAIVQECVQGDDGATQTTYFHRTSVCNSLSKSAWAPQNVTKSCTMPVDSSNTPWYKSPAFLITVIVLSSTIFLVVIAFALVKYYKIRKLYETYAQLDKDRGGPDDFSLPSESFELAPAKADEGL